MSKKMDTKEIKAYLKANHSEVIAVDCRMCRCWIKREDGTFTSAGFYKFITDTDLDKAIKCAIKYGSNIDPIHFEKF